MNIHILILFFLVFFAPIWELTKERKSFWVCGCFVAMDKVILCPFWSLYAVSLLFAWSDWLRGTECF